MVSLYNKTEYCHAHLFFAKKPSTNCGTFIQVFQKRNNHFNYFGFKRCKSHTPKTIYTFFLDLLQAFRNFENNGLFCLQMGKVMLIQSKKKFVNLSAPLVLSNPKLNTRNVVVNQYENKCNFIYSSGYFPFIYYKSTVFQNYTRSCLATVKMS